MKLENWRRFSIQIPSAFILLICCEKEFLWRWFLMAQTELTQTDRSVKRWQSKIVGESTSCKQMLILIWDYDNRAIKAIHMWKQIEKDFKKTVFANPNKTLRFSNRKFVRGKMFTKRNFLCNVIFKFIRFILLRILSKTSVRGWAWNISTCLFYSTLPATFMRHFSVTKVRPRKIHQPE